MSSSVLWIYQDDVVVDEASVYVDAKTSSLFKATVPASASGITVTNIGLDLRLHQVQIHQPSVEVTAVAPDGTVKKIEGTLLSQSADGVIRIAPSPSQEITLRSPYVVINHGAPVQHVQCLVERGGAGKLRLAYRMPAVDWQFRHEIVMLLKDGTATLTSSIHLTGSVLETPKQGLARLNFTTKRLGSSSHIKKGGTRVKSVRLHRRGDEEEGEAETLSAPTTQEGADAFGSWTVNAARLEPFCDMIFPVSHKVIADAQYRLVYMATNALKSAMPSTPLTYLDLSAPSTLEAIAAVEQGSLSVRIDETLIGDTFTLTPTSQQIGLGPLETLLIEEQLLKEDHKEKWREVQLTITNKSAETPPVPLHLWHYEASSVLVRLDERSNRWSDPYRAEVMPIQNTTACIVPISLSEKQRITTVVFRWYRK